MFEQTRLMAYKFSSRFYEQAKNINDENVDGWELFQFEAQIQDSGHDLKIMTSCPSILKGPLIKLFVLVS